MKITIEKGVHLPESLIIEILSWLPPKDLLRYKSVCKSWYDIISCPTFVYTHLENYYNNNDSWRTSLLVQYYVCQSELELIELFLDEMPQVIASEVLNCTPMHSSFVCGPCDGIYYLYRHRISDRALWNPTIDELKVLHPLITNPNLPSCVSFPGEDYGFGIDPLSRDYKVVVIKGFCSWTNEDEDCIRYPLSVFVYSLRIDSWKYCGDLTQVFRFRDCKCNTYLNGLCYWLGSYRQDDGDDENSDAVISEVIISFDMATDAFTEMNVPDYTQPSSSCLGIYDGCLAFLTLHEQIFDIWTLKEGTWMKELTVGPLPDISNPLGHWKNNYILFESYIGKLFLLDPASRELKALEFQHDGGDITCYGVIAYMESLVFNQR